MLKKQTCIKDVAKAAGVSVSTVSRVLSDSQVISEKTKEKVMKVVNSLDYKPNAIASALAKNRSNSIGIVIPDSDNEFYSTSFFQEALRGISTIASDKGYDVLISPGKPSEYLAVRNLVERRKVDGIILLRAHINDKSIKFLYESHFPFVLIGSSKEYDDIYTVDNDNFKAAYELTNHLIEQGRRKIAFIGGSVNYVYARERLEGYKKCIKDNKLLISPDLIKIDINKSQNAYIAFSDLIEKDNVPDAVIITDDTICAGVMDRIRECDIKVPSDIAVACFNDSIYNRFSAPPITSISVNSAELGKMAAETICNLLSGIEVKQKKVKVDFKLLVRESTKQALYFQRTS